MPVDQISAARRSRGGGPTKGCPAARSRRGSRGRTDPLLLAQHPAAGRTVAALSDGDEQCPVTRLYDAAAKVLPLGDDSLRQC